MIATELPEYFSCRHEMQGINMDSFYQSFFSLAFFKTDLDVLVKLLDDFSSQ